MTKTKVEAVRQETKAKEAEWWTASEASAAPAAAADGKSIKRRHAEASAGTAAAEAQEETENTKKFGPSYKKGRPLRSMKKNESVKSARRSKSTSEKTKGRKDRKIQKILEEVKGTKNISSIKSTKKRILIPKIQSKEGEAIKTRQGIANVFAKIYEDLYEGEEYYIEEETESRTENAGDDHEQDNNIKEFTTNEIQDAIDRQKRGKAKDGNGEQLKNCSDETEEKIRTVFNEIVHQEDFTPKSWRKIRVQVIYKKGGREDAGNYRPICSLPVLYKWFATVSYARLAPCLHRVQPQTKRGFGPIIDVTRTLWCTECWSSVVVSGVYFCTSARSTSQKHLIASNIQRYGTPCSATASSQLMSDYCKDFTVTKKGQY